MCGGGGDGGGGDGGGGEGGGSGLGGTEGGSNPLPEPCSPEPEPCSPDDQPEPWSAVTALETSRSMVQVSTDPGSVRTVHGQLGELHFPKAVVPLNFVT